MRSSRSRSSSPWPSHWSLGALTAGSAALVVGSRGRDAGLDRNRGGLCGTRREPLRLAAVLNTPEARELARPLDPGRVGDVPRPVREGPKSGVAARVLEPLADEGVGARRDRAGSRRNRDARPQEPGWDAHEPRHGLRARHPWRGYRRSTPRRADRGIHAVQARRTAAAPNGPDRGLSRRLDGAICELYAVRRPTRDTRARTRRPQAILCAARRFAARC